MSPQQTPTMQKNQKKMVVGAQVFFNRADSVRMSPYGHSAE